MKALVYTATRHSEIRQIDEPVPGAGETLVEVSHCGICGSDMHAWHGHDERRVPPLVLGHEAVGIALNGPHKGGRVAVNPLISCGACTHCRRQRPHLCAKRELIGMRIPGAFAQKLVIPERNVSPIDKGLDLERAALAEPTAVAVRAVHLARGCGAETDSRTVVIGGGAIGLLCAMVMRAGGFDAPHIAEPNALRRRAFDGLGLGAVYDPGAGEPDPGSMDLVFDAVGSGATRAAASRLARPGGVIVHLGLQDSVEGLDTRRITLQEITFQGAYCYRPRDFAEALELLGDGRVNGAGWAETRGLDEGAGAFVDIHEGRAPPKIILETS